MNATWLLLIGGIVMQTMKGQEIAGTYRVTGVREMVTGFQFKADGTFQFGLTYGAADYRAQGTWKKDRDSVILNAQHNGAPPFRQLKAEKGTDHLEVRVQTPQGQPIPNIGVILQGPEGALAQAQTDQTGTTHLDPNPQAKAIWFEVRVYQLEDGPHRLQPGKMAYTFEINGESILTPKFVNERLRIRNGNLELGYFNPDQPLVYRRDK